MYDVLVIGGGAAGFYGAIHIAEKCPTAKIAILERGNAVLTKVKVSGGGRCNVTHAAFKPHELAKHYPRGEKELLGPFHTHGPAEVMSFFKQRKVALKLEPDGRMFPVTDSSQTIIDCFLSETARLGITVFKKKSVQGFTYQEGENPHWTVATHEGAYKAKNLLITTGGSLKIWEVLGHLGHTVVPPAPSLFTFNINDVRISNLSGISTPATITVPPKKERYGTPKKDRNATTLQTQGAVLITHWGLSGPAVLKLSALGAFLFQEYGYTFKIIVNWAPDYHADGLLQLFMEVKRMERKTILRTKVLEIPKRLWHNLVKASGIPDKLSWPQATKEQLKKLAEQITHTTFYVEGKSTYKEEFVTAGGVDLKEVDFKTFGSKVLPNVFFAGEILNIDAVTGGFNFQNAWTGAFIAARAISENLQNKQLS